MNTPKRPRALLVAAQVICALAVPLTLFFTMTPIVMLYDYLEQASMMHLDMMPILLSGGPLCLRDAVLGICLVCVETEAIGVCQRVKKASAFCAKNEKALGHIALALCLAGLLTLLFGDSVVPFLLTGLPAVSPIVERLLMPFMLLTLAGMLRAVQLLMQRAMTMQDENTLTI